MIPLFEIEKELNEFCPELHPHVGYSSNGIEVRCNWALQYIIDSMYPIECAKEEMLIYLYQHLGKLTVLIRRLEKVRDERV